MNGFLSPAGRKAIYSALGALATFVVILGLAPRVTVDTWLALVPPVLGFAALILASIKAQRVDFTALYGAAAAVVGALVVAGFLNEGVASKVYELMAAAAAAIPLLIAAMRTNSQVPDGQPIAEYVAPRHAPDASMKSV